MAKIQVKLPDETMAQLRRIEKDAPRIFGQMCREAAKTVEADIRANAPAKLKQSQIMRCLKTSRAYKTPSDGAINAYTGFYGYYTNRKKKRVPAPLVANLYEYGRSNAPFPKQPFVRRSFNASKIERVMRQVQARESGGILQ